MITFLEWVKGAFQRRMFERDPVDQSPRGEEEVITLMRVLEQKSRECVRLQDKLNKQATSLEAAYAMIRRMRPRIEALQGNHNHQAEALRRLRGRQKINSQHVTAEILMKMWRYQHAVEICLEDLDWSKIDLIFAHHHDALRAAYALAHHGGGNIPILFDCVEHPIHHLRTGGTIADYLSVNPIEREAFQVHMDILVKTSASVIMTSPRGLDYFNQLRVPAELILNSRELAFQQSAVRNIRDDVGADAETGVVLYLNNAYPRSGFEEFIGVAQAMAGNNRFAFLGKFRLPEWEHRLDTFLDAHEVDDRFVALELVPQREVISYISGADCMFCAFDPEDDGFRGLLPLRFFDGVLAGLPIVAPKKTEIAHEVETRGIGVTYDPGEHISATREALRMKSSPAFQKNSAKAKAELDWSAQEKILDAHIRTLLGGRTPRTSIVLGVKPFDANQRLRNLCSTLAGMGGEVYAVGTGAPAALAVDRVIYRSVSI